MNRIKKSYYKNGNIKKEIPYVNGKINGQSILYYENGNIKCIIDYCDGHKNGYIRTYYDDGSLESQETYTMGIKNNDLVIYNRNETNDIDYNEYYIKMMQF